MPLCPSTRSHPSLCASRDSVKTGQDAKRLAVIDIWWDSQGELHSSVALVPSCVFPAHKETQAYVDGQTALLEASSSLSSLSAFLSPLHLPFFTLPPPDSTADTTHMSE